MKTRGGESGDGRGESGRGRGAEGGEDEHEAEEEEEGAGEEADGARGDETVEETAEQNGHQRRGAEGQAGRQAYRETAVDRALGEDGQLGLVAEFGEEDESEGRKEEFPVHGGLRESADDAAVVDGDGVGFVGIGLVRLPGGEFGVFEQDAAVLEIEGDGVARKDAGADARREVGRQSE